MSQKHLFGPVPSRRLGISLGIDLVPYKTCTFNCIYCECGTTTNYTAKRKEYVPTTEVIEELDQTLKSNPNLDYITFSGSGEPTLHNGIGQIVSFLKKNYSEYKIALLTNGTLLTDDSLRKEVINIDLIIPSLDAVSESTLIKINRPLQKINNKKIINGLSELNKEFTGQIWLEVFIVKGINDTEKELKLFKDAFKKINPDKIQLNTLDRPGTENWVKPVSDSRLKEIADFFGGNVEIITSFKQKPKTSDQNNIKTNILETLKRRPCTVKDLAEILDLNTNEIYKYLNNLSNNDQIKFKRENRGIFYYFQK